MSQSVPARLGAFDAEDAPSMDGLRACVHCGICLPQCPTYRVLGEEMDSPRGRVYLMRAAAEDRIALTPTMARHLDLCLGCRACETACPSGVPFGQLLEATRGQFERRGVTAPQRDSATLRFLLEVFPHPGRLGPMLHALRMYQWSGMQVLVRGLGLLAPFAKLRAMEALLPPVPAPAAPLPEVVPARGGRAVCPARARRLGGARGRRPAAPPASPDRDLPRRLPPGPRAARARRAPQPAAPHPGADPGGSARRRALLRERGRLQPARARDGGRARPPEGGAHPGDRRARGGGGQPGLPDADPPALPRAGPRDRSRAPGD